MSWLRHLILGISVVLAAAALFISLVWKQATHPTNSASVEEPPAAVTPPLTVHKGSTEAPEPPPVKKKIPEPAPMPAHAPPLPKPAKTPRTALLVSQDDDKLYTSFWPKSSIQILNDLRDDPDLIFYDEQAVPRGYQVFDEPNGRFHRTDEGQASANNEFPWRNPQGVGDGIKAIKFVRLKGMDITRGRDVSGNFTGFDWTYRKGTTFGEILLVADSKGSDHPAILRTKFKGEDGEWKANEYVPFPTEDEFREAFGKIGWKYGDPQVTLQRLDSSLAPANHQHNAFRSIAHAKMLPLLTEEMTLALLKRPFQIGTGKQWSAKEDVTAPTTGQDFSIVPKGYTGGFVFRDNESCMKCHQDAGKVVNLTGHSRWRLRGSDGIFSFHPFDTSDGTLRINGKLEGAGLARFHDTDN
jgi:hypothetical protein